MKTPELREVVNPTDEALSGAEAAMDAMPTTPRIAETGGSGVFNDIDVWELDQEARAQDSTTAYLSQIRKERLLSEDEEIDLAKKIEAGREAGAQLAADGALPEDEKLELMRVVAEGAAAKHDLVRGNLRLAALIARDYTGRGLPYLDIVQNANLGLFRAADRFDYRRGVPFGKFAPWDIRRSIGEEMVEQSRIIHLPHHVARAANKINRVSHELWEKLGREPKIEEIATKANLTVEKVQTALRHKEPLSLQYPVRSLGHGDEVMLGDELEGDNTETVVDEAYRRVVRTAIDKALDDLPEQHAKVVKLKFGLVDNKKRSDQEVAEVLGKSREWVRLAQRDHITPYLHGPLKNLLSPYADEYAS